jgi:hypothetical protein
MVYYKIKTPKGANCIYIWGDSQMNRGLDLDYLNKNSAYSFYSSAQDGAGVYDLLVFSEMVPENSTVVISVSRPVILRRKALDRNVSAFNFKSLHLLYKNNYSANEIFRIVTKNLSPHKMFTRENKLFENSDSMRVADPMSMFEDIYKNRPAYFYDKTNLFIEGIRNLDRKKCRIIAIVFPYHPILNAIERSSPYLPELKIFDGKVAELFSNEKEVVINSEKNIFRDLTHLNKRGAGLLSKELLSLMGIKEKSLLIKAE